VPESSKVDHDPQELPVTSSIPMQVPEEQATLFREVLTALEEKQFPTRFQELLLCERILEFAGSPKILISS
jgi:hypothetical protein